MLNFCIMIQPLFKNSEKEHDLSINRNSLKFNNIRASIAVTKYQRIHDDYLKPASAYVNTAVFNDSGLSLDSNDLIPISPNTLKRLPYLLGSPRWNQAVLSFTTQVDNNPARTCSVSSINALLAICVKYKQPIIIHTSYLSSKINTDSLQQLKSLQCIHILWRIASFNKEIHQIIEPRSTAYTDRLINLQYWHEQGLDCGVVVSPIVEGVNAHHVYEVMRLASMAGAKWAACDLPNAQLNNLFNRYFEQFSFNQSIPAIFISCYSTNNKMTSLLF